MVLKAKKGGCGVRGEMGPVFGVSPTALNGFVNPIARGYALFHLLPNILPLVVTFLNIS